MAVAFRSRIIARSTTIAAAARSLNSAFGSFVQL
jgi:hypothetical protein